MSPILNFFIRIFLLMSILMLMLTLFFDFLIAKPFVFQSLIFQSISFGFIMSIFMVSMQVYGLKKIGIQRIMQEDLETTRKGKFRTKLNREEVINKLMTALGTSNMKMNDIENEVSWNTGITLKSWGEKIMIKLISKTDSEYEYEISSAPLLKTTLIDGGKNIQNVNHIESIFKNTNLK